MRLVSSVHLKPTFSIFNQGKIFLRSFILLTLLVPTGLVEYPTSFVPNAQRGFMLSSCILPVIKIDLSKYICYRNLWF